MNSDYNKSTGHDLAASMRSTATAAMINRTVSHFRLGQHVVWISFKTSHLFHYMLQAWLNLGRFVPKEHLGKAWKQVSDLLEFELRGANNLANVFIEDVYADRLADRLLEKNITQQPRNA
jgi:hypothetical protein